MRMKWETATIIPAEGYALIGKLHEKELLKLKKKWRALFKNHAPAAAGLLSVDVSLNLDAGTGGKNHWQIHLHGIFANVSTREWGRIREHLAADVGGRRLFVESATNPIGQLAYMAKPNFVRRVKIIDKRAKANTRIERLSAVQEFELVRWLSPHRTTSRFINIGSISDTIL